MGSGSALVCPSKQQRGRADWARDFVWLHSFLPPSHATTTPRNAGNGSSPQLYRHGILAADETPPCLSLKLVYDQSGVKVGEVAKLSLFCPKGKCRQMWNVRNFGLARKWGKKEEGGARRRRVQHRPLEMTQEYRVLPQKHFPKDPTNVSTSEQRHWKQFKVKIVINRRQISIACHLP